MHEVKIADFALHLLGSIEEQLPLFLALCWLFLCNFWFTSWSVLARSSWTIDRVCLKSIVSSRTTETPKFSKTHFG